MALEEALVEWASTRRAVVGPTNAATRLMITPGHAGGHGENQAHASTSPK
jgi:hypothetical protein